MPHLKSHSLLASKFHLTMYRYRWSFTQKKASPYYHSNCYSEPPVALYPSILPVYVSLVHLCISFCPVSIPITHNSSYPLLCCYFIFDRFFMFLPASHKTFHGVYLSQGCLDIYTFQKVHCDFSGEIPRKRYILQLAFLDVSYIIANCCFCSSGPLCIEHIVHIVHSTQQTTILAVPRGRTSQLDSKGPTTLFCQGFHPLAAHFLECVDV